MVENLFIPKLGMTMEKATIAEWKFKDGDKVAKGDVVLVIDTEKVAHEIESPTDGLLVVIASVGEELPCGAVIGMVAQTKEEYEKAKKENPAGSTGKVTVEESVVGSSAEKKSSGAGKKAGGKIFISPAAKKLAEKNNFDYSAISGSGPNGRITREDIEKAMAEGPKAGTSEPNKPTTAPACAPSADVIDGKRVKSVIPLTGMRKIISDHMRHSLDTAARVTSFGEVDMTKLIELRKRYVAKADALGFRITYTDLFILFAAKGLKSVPIMNSSMIGNEIKIWEDINVGFAVSVFTGNGQSGLVVPVIKNTDRLSLGEIAKQRKELTDKARTGKLSIDEMMGGTFTITNTGTFSSVWHIQTPIINQPQAAILGTSSIVEKPVVENGEIVIRPMMPVSFTFDHRIMDGAPPAQFLSKIGEMILDPDMIIV